MPHQTWLVILSLCALTVPTWSSHVYVSVLTRSQELTWAAIGGVNVTNTSLLVKTYNFTPGNVTKNETVSSVGNSNGNVSELPAECLKRNSDYLGTIWIFHCNDTEMTVDEFWYRGDGYDHSQQNCTSPLVSYLKTMCDLRRNHTSANKSFEQNPLTAPTLRCIVPETYSINDTIKHYNQTGLSRDDQKTYRDRYPQNNTCSLTEALIVDELKSFIAMSKLLMLTIEGLSFVAVAIFATIVLIRYYYWNKPPCAWMLPRSPRRADCEEIVIESKAEQTESGEDTAPNSPSEPENTETTPILSASMKPHRDKPPAVPPKPTTFTIDAAKFTQKPPLPPKPKPKSLVFQYPSPRSATKSAKATKSPKVFTFNEHDIRKHREEITKSRVLYPAQQLTTPVDSVLTPLLPPPPPGPSIRRVSGSPRVPVMIPWDITQPTSPMSINPWTQRDRPLPSELDPWALKANRWL
ncbi:Ba36 [Baboon cytomegalovirus]|nr:Ba36 [Baboon cytomegalovirus]